MVSITCIQVGVLFSFLVVLSNAKSVTLPDDPRNFDQLQKKQDTLIEDVKPNQSPFNSATDSIRDSASSTNNVKKIAKDFILPPRQFLNTQKSFRNNKMLDYFAYFPEPIVPPYQPSEYYTQNGYYNQMNPMEVDEYMSRVNRRRPSANENSPIYYIRLPPTPYMFVPGMGYISQPPTLQPLASQYSMPPQPVPVNPFVNVPVNFISNGKPTNVYQWNAAQVWGPQYPSYLPTRPQHRPGYRLKPYLQDSKITNLKSTYVFNGRPEDVYVLPNDSYQHHPHRHQYNTGFPAHTYNNQLYTPYNSDPIQSFY